MKTTWMVREGAVCRGCMNIIMTRRQLRKHKTSKTQGKDRLKQVWLYTGRRQGRGRRPAGVGAHGQTTAPTIFGSPIRSDIFAGASRWQFGKNLREHGQKSRSHTLQMNGVCLPVSHRCGAIIMTGESCKVSERSE